MRLRGDRARCARVTAQAGRDGGEKIDGSAERFLVAGNNDSPHEPVRAEHDDGAGHDAVFIEPAGHLGVGELQRKHAGADLRRPTGRKKIDPRRLGRRSALALGEAEQATRVDVNPDYRPARTDGVVEADGVSVRVAHGRLREQLSIKGMDSAGKADESARRKRGRGFIRDWRSHVAAPGVRRATGMTRSRSVVRTGFPVLTRTLLSTERFIIALA